MRIWYGIVAGGVMFALSKEALTTAGAETVDDFVANGTVEGLEFIGETNVQGGAGVESAGAGASTVEQSDDIENIETENTQPAAAGNQSS